MSLNTEMIHLDKVVKSFYTMSINLPFSIVNNANVICFFIDNKQSCFQCIFFGFIDDNVYIGFHQTRMKSICQYQNHCLQRYTKQVIHQVYFDKYLYLLENTFCLLKIFNVSICLT